jgi:hypothetical protein
MVRVIVLPVKFGVIPSDIALHVSINEYQSLQSIGTRSDVEYASMILQCMFYNDIELDIMDANNIQFSDTNLLRDITSMLKRYNPSNIEKHKNSNISQNHKRNILQMLKNS